MARQMKDSGIEWIGEIPVDWSMKRVKHIFTRKNEKVMQENPTILSLARDGVKVRDISNNEGQIAESYYNYNPVEKGDLLLNPMDLYSGANCSISKVQGVISPAYINLRANAGINPTFYDYYFKVQYWLMVFFSYGKGVSYDNRWTLSAETLMNYPAVALSYEEQCKRANYLDRKCAQIDAIISKQQQIIEKLKEYKLSIITEAVTKGLDPNVPMKDSGVEWIGMVPEEWRISRIKYICEFNPGTKKANHDVVSYAPMECVKDGYLIKKEIRHDGISTGLTSFEEGDIIMAKVTPCFENGNIAIAKDLVNKFGVGSSELFVFRAKKVNTQWLFYFLRNSIFKKLAEATMTGTGGLKRVSPSFIRDFSLALPPEKEQRRIIEYLDKKCMEIDRVIKYKQSAVEKLGQYKKSLIYEVVTGKMEV